MKLTEQLIQAIPKMEPVTFAGLAKLLGVRTIEQNEDSEPIVRDFTDVLNDVLQAYDKKDRKLKREILKVVKKANSYKKEVLRDASNTLDT